MLYLDRQTNPYSILYLADPSPYQYPPNIGFLALSDPEVTPRATPLIVA